VLSVFPSISADATSSGNTGYLSVTCSYTVQLTANAENFDFSNYPSPPPPGSTPHATTATTYQKALSDGTGYYATAYTDQSAATGINKLQC
jgi:hypothetical protein